jgi:superfamily II DNA helicase RecQ
MGSDSPSITRVIHAKPPRRAVDFMQQIGRAVRKGQPACSKVFFNSNDIGHGDIEQAMKDYCTSDCCMSTYVESTMLVLSFEEGSESEREMPKVQCIHLSTTFVHLLKKKMFVPCFRGPHTT